MGSEMCIRDRSREVWADPYHLYWAGEPPQGYIPAAALPDSQSEKYTGLLMAVKPSMPVITTLLYPLAQWMMSRLPLSSLPPTMPTWLSPG